MADRDLEQQMQRWQDAEGRQRQIAKMLRNALALVPPDARKEADAYLKACRDAGYVDA